VFILLFSAVAGWAGDREVMSGKDMKSKLGLLYLDGGQPAQNLLPVVDGGKVPIMKIPVNDLSRPDSVAVRLKKANPKAIVVVGIGAQGSDMKAYRDPDEVFAKWMKEKEGNLKTLQANRGRVDFVSFMPNMWEPASVEEAVWYCRYVALAAPEIAEMGFRPIILQSGVGGLPIKPEILDAMLPAFRTAKRCGGAWACHGYTLDYTMDAGRESFTSLRYRRAYSYLRKAHPDVADLPMILMEGGVDKAGDPNKDGWQARGSQEKFTEWLGWFDSELMKDSQVLGVCLFKIGGADGWKSFDLDPVAPWLAGYLKGK
jgi:hypothetical protein